MAVVTLGSNYNDRLGSTSSTLVSETPLSFGSTSLSSFPSVSLASSSTTSSGVSDHGELTGLSDNDHNQYALLDASNQPFTGNIGINTSDYANLDTFRIHKNTAGDYANVRLTNLTTGTGANKGISLSLTTGGKGALVHYENTDLEIYTNNVRRATFAAAGGLDVVGGITGNTLTSDTSLTLGTGSTVDTIETVLTNDDTHLPTSGAVYGAIAGAGGMVYPGVGIAVSTGAAWDTSLTDNSANWNTAYGWGDHSSAGYIDGSGTDNQVAVFSDSDTIEGDANLTYASASGLLTVTNINISGNLNVDGIAEYTASAGVTIESVVLEDGGITLGTGATVDTIETSIINDDTHIPTSGAVVDYIGSYSYNHNELGAIQGGSADQYYHMTSAEYVNVGNLDSMAYEATTSYYTSGEVDTLLGDYPDISGTPVLNELAVWSDADTLKGDSNLTWDLATLQVTGTMAATTVTGANVTSGSNPGHTHTTSAISNLSSYTGLDARYYTETELNTDGGGGQVHWNNIVAVPPSVSGAMASFLINTDGEASTSITDGETVSFSEGSNMSVTRSNNTITFASTQRGIDSEPVSAQETESISSGWAYNHVDSASAHHTKYLDSEAVSAVAAADDYLKNDANDTTSGTITAAGFIISGGYDVYSEADVAWINTDNDNNFTWNFNTSHNYEWVPSSVSSATLAISNMVDGDSGVLIIKSDTTGTLTLPANSDPSTISYTSSAVVVATVLKWIDVSTTRYIWAVRTTAVSPT